MWSGPSRRGSCVTSSATASATLSRIGATWSRSTIGIGLGVDARLNASASCSGVTPANRSGAMPRNGSSMPDGARHRQSGAVTELVERAGRVLERLALEQAGDQQVALFPQRQLLVEVDVVAARQQATGLELDQHGRGQQEVRRHAPGRDPCIRSSSATNASTMSDSCTSHSSTSSLVMRWSRRSNGPVKTGRYNVVWHRPQEYRAGSLGTAPRRFLSMTRVLSGIQPTGEFHLGNFIGAVQSLGGGPARTRVASTAWSISTR